MIDVPLVWRLVVMAIAFGTLPAMIVVWLIHWWAGSSRAAVLLRSDVRRWRARVCHMARRAARRSTRTPAGAGCAPDRPASAGHHRHDRVGGA